MTHQISPTSHGDQLSSGAFSLAFHSARKTSPNLHYGKYTELYQYVTPFSAESHAAAADDSQTCEKLLRNKRVMQQGFAC